MVYLSKTVDLSMAINHQRVNKPGGKGATRDILPMSENGSPNHVRHSKVA
jgi:hypothetical protein